MRKTKAIARAAVASLATAALASVSLGGTAFAWGDEDKEHEKAPAGNTEITNCNSGGGMIGNNNTTSAGGPLVSLIPIAAGINGNLSGDSVLSPNFCG
jgi:hypothetical protein